MEMELNLILLIPDSMILGWQYFKPEEGFEYSELNLFFFFFQIQYRSKKKPH